jgi:purine-binding chemotaxis protein CheW
MTLATADRAAALRLAFDRSFAEPVVAEAAKREDFLLIRIGEARWAVRFGEIAGLHADRRITPVPSATPALLGIAGFRGTILPIYDLRYLTGSVGGTAPRWLVVAAGGSAGFAFDGFDRHLRATPDAILMPGAAGADHESLRHEDELVPVIRMASLVERVTRPATRSELAGED